MGAENGRMGFDPENLDDRQDAESSQSESPLQNAMAKHETRRSFSRRLGIAGAVVLGSGLIPHQRAAAQEATSPMIVPLKDETPVPDGDTTIGSGGDAVATGPAIQPLATGDAEANTPMDTMIVPGTGDTAATNLDAQSGSDGNAGATDSAIQSMAKNDGESSIVNPAEQSGEFNYLNGRLDGPLDVDREYLQKLYPTTDGQALAESLALQSGFHLIVNPDGSVVLDYDVQSATNPQVRALKPKVDYFVLYPTPDDYEKKKGVVVQATADTQNLENDADAMSLFNGGQFRGFTIEAVGSVNGKQNVVLAQTGGMNMGVSVSNDRPGVTESQTTPVATTEVAPTIAPTESQDNQEGHGSGPSIVNVVLKGAAGGLLAAGAVIGLTAKGKKREGE